MRNLLLILTMTFTLIAMVPISANAMGFTVQTDRTVVSRGERVTIVATLVSPKRVREAPRPASNEHFDLLSVNLGTYSSMMVNFRSVEHSHQFIYTIVPKTDGPFTFPALTVNIDGTDVSSPPLHFNAGGNTAAITEPARSPDIKAFLTISNNSLFPGEQAILTLKVITKLNSPIQTQRGYNNAIEQIERVFGREFSLNKLFSNHVTQGNEDIGGERYNTFTLRYAVFGLTPGEYSIPSVTFEYDEIRRVQGSRRMNPFFNDPFFDDPFFGGGTQAVRGAVRTSPFTVTVKPLPSGAPVGFGGSVGKFSVAAEAEPRTVPAGEAVTLRVTLRGNTRASNVSDPVMPEIRDSDIFTPERQTAVDTGAGGLSTVKTYRYLIIPREEGDLTIDPITYPYLDPETGRYRTAQTNPITINVTQGKGGPREQTRYLTQEDIRQVGHDIRYIKTPSTIKHQEERPYRAPYWYFLFSMPFLLFLTVLIYKLQSARSNANHSKNIRQKALENAVKELNRASKICGNDSDFLGRVSIVIEKYISNKLVIPATGRTLEELKDELLSRKIDEQTVTGLTALIEGINEYRFGGKAFDTRSRGDIINKTTKFLSTMEKVVRKEKKLSAIILTLTALTTFISPASASVSSGNVNEWFATANDFYAAGSFDSALVYYTKIQDAGIRNGAVYFNMGNTYHRLRKPGMARLHYEKAAVLEPNDQDISANIDFVKSIIVDRVADADESDFVAAVAYNIHTLLSLEMQLIILCALLFILALLSSAMLLKKGLTRLWLAYGAVLCFILIAAVGASAGYKIYALESRQYAIVMTQSLDAKNQPGGTQTLFTAHEGTKLRINKTNGEWSLISLPNGASGWVTTASLGRI